MPNVNQGSLATQLQTIINGLVVNSQTKERLITLAKSAQMVGANASVITARLETLISTLPSSEELKEVALLIVSLALITDNRILSVPTINDLPATAAAGSVYFVDSLGLPYIRRINGTWIIIEPNQTLTNAYAWGTASEGRLGDGTAVSKSSPVAVVGGFTDWVQVSASIHTVGIRANGTAWAWGRNSVGQLGDDTTVSKSSPVSVVGGFADWIQVDAGETSTFGVRANGTAWGWGGNSDGRLGDGTTVSKSSPVSVIGGFTDWVEVSAGVGSSSHTVGVRANGTAWAWGNNGYGRLGDDTTVAKSSPVSVVGGFTDWVEVSGAIEHTVGVRANGTAWAWGSNFNGRLGDNTTVAKSSPVSVVGGFTDWVQVSASSHTVGVRANGTAWAWGLNDAGRLGDNTIINASSPVSVVGGFTDWVQVIAGAAHTVGLRANGTAWGWGAGAVGRLGDNTTVDKSSPVSVVGGFTDWVQISAGVHTVALRS
jgi:alpha-tubulin suppressor-like RCC1 family protein